MLNKNPPGKCGSRDTRILENAAMQSEGKDRSLFANSIARVARYDKLGHGGGKSGLDTLQ
jgi:hypothetical protein